MKFAYIGGPYRAKHPYQVDRNIREAKRVGEELAIMGYFPVIPHVNTAHMDGIQDDAFWLDGTLELMRRTADVLVLLPNWEDSAGSLSESRVASLSMSIPVHHWPEDELALKLFAMTENLHKK